MENAGLKPGTAAAASGSETGPPGRCPLGRASPSSLRRGAAVDSNDVIAVTLLSNIAPERQSPSNVQLISSTNERMERMI